MIFRIRKLRIFFDATIYCVVAILNKKMFYKLRVIRLEPFRNDCRVRRIYLTCSSKFYLRQFALHSVPQSLAYMEFMQIDT